MIVSLVCGFAFGDCVRVVQPVDVVDKFVSLRAETDWFDMQVFEAQVVWIHAQVLRLDGHKLWSEPRAEPLAVERLIPRHVMIVENILEWSRRHIWLDLANVKEHLVDLLVYVSMGTTQIIRFSNRFFHLQKVKDGKSNIIGENRLNVCIHTLDLP